MGTQCSFTSETFSECDTDSQMSAVAVVTGGNRGIGFEIARGCVRSGFRVVIACRDEGRASEAAEQLGCEWVQLDLDSETSVVECAREIERRYREIDVLINNASIAYKHADPTPWTVKARTTMTTNFFGTLAVCQTLFPLIKEGGRVVTVSSGAAHLGIIPSRELQGELASADSTLEVPRLAELMSQFVADVEESRSRASAPDSSWPHVAKGWPNHAYGMTKLGQVALTKIHARELAPRSISVNCYDPGSVATGMNQRGSRSPAQGADTAVWLAVQSSTFATGQFFRDRRAMAW